MKWKKSIPVFLLLLLSVQTIPVRAADEQNSCHLVYTENTDGTQTITGCTGTVPGAWTLPEQIDGKAVTGIGSWAFENYSGFTGPFSLPEHVKKIGEGAFWGCRSLTGCLAIPDGVTCIEDWTFYDCDGLTGSLSMPENLTYIGTGAFYDCDGLTGHLTIPAGVTHVGDSAFYDCHGLTGCLTIPAGVTRIERYAFSGCSGLTGQLTLPENVTGIGNFAFYGCHGLTGCVTLPEGVASIGEYAFSGCSGLTGIYFEGNAPAVGVHSFAENCTLYYRSGTTGWTDSPGYDAAAGTWNGYALELWDTDISKNIVSPAPETAGDCGNRFRVMN